jgi:hypothetical protein
LSAARIVGLKSGDLMSRKKINKGATAAAMAHAINTLFRYLAERINSIPLLVDGYFATIP